MRVQVLERGDVRGYCRRGRCRCSYAGVRNGGDAFESVSVKGCKDGPILMTANPSRRLQPSEPHATRERALEQRSRAKAVSERSRHALDRMGHPALRFNDVSKRRQAPVLVAMSDALRSVYSAGDVAEVVTRGMQCVHQSENADYTLV